MTGNAQVLDAPTFVELPFIVSMTAVVNTTGKEITLALGTSGVVAGSALVIEASQPSSPGKYNYDGSYRQITYAPNGAVPSKSDLYNAYETKFGAPPTGKKIAFRCYFVNKDAGNASPRFSATAIATP